MKRYAVMGSPIAHSLSPEIHHLFAREFGLDIVYEKMLAEDCGFEAQVLAFFQAGGLGLNVTLPFKARAYHLADQVLPAAAEAKAANTLWMEKGRLFADNTDGRGFIADIKKYQALAGKKILILGAGGAAQGIIPAILDLQPASLDIANRNLEKAEQLALNWPALHPLPFEAISPSYDILINATSMGLQPNQPWPLDERLLANHPFVYDLSYRLDKPTAFVDWASSAGCQALDGLGMLVAQAAYAFEIWHGLFPAIDPVIKQLEQYRSNP